ncbi:MAG TPA: CDP-alcohol phosphatidyltransferase family protein [Mycobacteriales bacterium]|nr:CDP-alcohol phosphatidyltransferase family protein [Mycobacteriales bacterium]
MTPTTGESLTGVQGPVDRVVTIPNLLSVLRLLGVPLFLWLLLGPEADLAALIVLMAAGLSDYFDGKIARWLNQTSKIGVLLDPAADRLYILATLFAFVARDIIPWWLAALIVGRDLLLVPTLPLLRRHGYGPLQVSYLGKAATFNLLYAFPLLLIAANDWAVSDVARPVAWAFVVWGTALYLFSGGLYLTQVVQVVRADRR